MSRTYLDLLEDILESIEKINSVIKDTDFKNFEQDVTKNLAVERALITIGEAASKIPDDIKNNTMK
jgi:uncharacterized protein with HEPN domain